MGIPIIKPYPTYSYLPNHSCVPQYAAPSAREDSWAPLENDTRRTLANVLCHLLPGVQTCGQTTHYSNPKTGIHLDIKGNEVYLYGSKVGDLAKGFNLQFFARVPMKNSPSFQSNGTISVEITTHQRDRSLTVTQCTLGDSFFAVPSEVMASSAAKSCTVDEIGWDGQVTHRTIETLQKQTITPEGHKTTTVDVETAHTHAGSCFHSIIEEFDKPK